jgi:prevent-host-death family protein
MRTMSAKDAKNRFGELLLEAQREPVTIERNGRPVAVVLSFEDHAELERLKLDWLRAAVAEAEADASLGRVRPFGPEVIDEILHEARRRVERGTTSG